MGEGEGEGGGRQKEGTLYEDCGVRLKCCVIWGGFSTMQVMKYSSRATELLALSGLTCVSMCC